MMTPTRLAEIEAAHGKATPRISMDRVSELQAECNNRHMLDPLWNQLANALGAQGFDLVDARNDIGELAAALREAWAIIVAKDAHINILDDECVTKDSEIERLRAAGDAMEWRSDMENAPRDGTVIDIWVEFLDYADRDSDKLTTIAAYRVSDVCWWDGAWRDEDGNDDERLSDRNYRVIAWMPLPAPPRLDQTGEGKGG